MEGEAGDGVAGTLWLLAVAVLVGFLYVLPIIIARGPDRRRIVWLTILTGWTVVGWGIALAWAIRAAEAHPPSLPPE